MRKETRLCFFALVLVLGFLTGTFCVFVEHAETTGYTPLGLSSKDFDGNSYVDNYAVFHKNRYISIVTGLAPARIIERNSKIVRADTLVSRGRILITYRPATTAEEALWHRYF